MEKLSVTGVNKHATPDDFATLSAVILTPDEVFIDNGAIHGKSRVERGIQFVAKTPEEVVGGVPVYIVWVTLRREAGESGYNGLTVSKLMIHKEANAGYKSVPDLVNKMDAAIKGKLDITLLTPRDQERLGLFLKQFREGQLWEHAKEEVHQLFPAHDNENRE